MKPRGLRKLPRPFVVGDIIKTNYNSGPYRIIEIRDGCTCAHPVDQINTVGHGKPRPGHLHFTLVGHDEPPTQSGTYADSKKFWLNGYIYKNGECVDVSGPLPKGSTGRGMQPACDKGVNKILLVQAYAPKPGALSPDGQSVYVLDGWVRAGMYVHGFKRGNIPRKESLPVIEVLSKHGTGIFKLRYGDGLVLESNPAAFALAEPPARSMTQTDAWSNL